MRRAATALPASFVAVACLAMSTSPAAAELKIYESSEAATELGTIKRLKCHVRRAAGERYFGANGESTNGAFELTALIDTGFWGGFRDDYTLYYGVREVSVGLFDGNDAYDTEYAPPGTPPGVVWAGGMKFSRQGKKLAIGAYGVPNQDFSYGYSVVGKAKCRYPRR